MRRGEFSYRGESVAGDQRDAGLTRHHFVSPAPEISSPNT